MSDKKQPHESVYYCLLTLEGDFVSEMPETAALVERNRRWWDTWLSTSEEGTKALRDQGIVKAAMATKAKRLELTRLLTRRSNGVHSQLPNSSHTPIIADVTFPRAVKLSNANFPFGLEFRNCEFEGDLSFTRVTAGGSFALTACRLAGVNSIDACRFIGFEIVDSQFLLGMTITATSAHSITVSRSEIDGPVHVMDISQARQISLADTQFGSQLMVLPQGEATNLKISRCDVAGDLDCSAAQFASVAMKNVRVNHRVSFAKTRIAGISMLRGCRFGSAVSFLGAQFGGLTAFDRTTFLTLPPDFRDCKLMEATTFFGVGWPRPASNSLEAQIALVAYERLKQEMERLKKHEDEQLFFRKELRTRRELYPSTVGGQINRLLNWLYQVTSNYGASASLPLAWLVGIWAVGAAIFANIHVFAGAPLAWGDAAAVSFANIFPFLPLRGDIMEIFDPGQAYGILHAVAAVQAIGSAFMLFLFGLALRSRFRMR